MKILWLLIEKEFKQIFRDKFLMAIIFVMPILELIILPLAANFEIEHINVCFVDHDHSDISRKFANKVLSSGYFVLTDYKNTYQEALYEVERDEADVVVE
ncbi:MAG: ABC transporter permease, partial [Bacteroidales bacterium]|nr:ABC transporter permease [Bacteroidales bacterium]